MDCKRAKLLHFFTSSFTDELVDLPRDQTQFGMPLLIFIA